jgi:hypothetical protein
MHWGVEWHYKNKTDGECREILWENCLPLLFPTRQLARSYIARRYGYIRYRPDLRREPHGWRIPQAVRVKVSLKRANYKKETD